MPDNLKSLAFGLILITSHSSGEEPGWPAWRGPNRDGVSPEDTPLMTTLSDEGPAILWHTKGLPSGGEGGYSSPVVADGRVYLYLHWRYRVPFPSRTLSTPALRRLGWIPEPLPPDVRSAVESARLSSEREALRGEDLRTWIEKWLETHLDETQAKKFGADLNRRLRDGKRALPLDALDVLATVKERKFENHEELEGWMRSHDVTGELRERALSVIPTDEQRSKDVVVCLDAGTGKTLWQKESPGTGSGSSSTLCVRDGRCYGIYSTREAFCLDARTGAELWRAKCGGGHSSFLVEQGMAITLADQLTALNAATGEVVWTQPEVRGRENSVVSWEKDGESFLVCNTNKDVACVELRTGGLRWKVQGGGPSTAVLRDGYMAILTNRGETGLVAYRVSPHKAEQLWNIPDLTDRGASPIIHQGHVYAVAGSKTVCVDVESGAVRWQANPGRGDVCSPLLADGKLVALLGGRALAIMLATPDRYQLLGKARLAAASCASPALTGGRLYVRMRDGLACLDLRRKQDGAR